MEECMLKASLLTFACVGCLVSIPVPSPAQELIHALTGTVASINPDRTISVLQDNGSTGDFQTESNPKTRIEFDKRIAAEATTVSTFKSQGAYVIVFYFGGVTRPRTVVALKNLGAGPFTSTVGTVEKFDGHARSLTVEDKSGKVHTFVINADTVAEGNFGAVDGLRFQAQKGDSVRVVATEANGNPTALFVRDN
jgi:hypothetical protein